jgi:hypothetical protein
MKLAHFLLASSLLFSSNIFADDTLEASDLIGKYSCTFTQDGYTYSPFPCVISPTTEGIQLEKTAGSQRIKGLINITEEGFDFSGTYFCPFGDCTSDASGSFAKTDKGFKGTVKTDDGASSNTVVDLIKNK